MEEGREVVGQIKVNIYTKGAPEVLITGHIPPRIMIRMPHLISMGARKARGEQMHAIHKQKAAEAAEIAKKNTAAAQPAFTEPEPIPEPTESLKMPPDLDQRPAPAVDQFIPDASDEGVLEQDAPEGAETEEANNPNESEEQEDGTDKGTEAVRGDDEEQGGKGSPKWGVTGQGTGGAS